VTAAASPTASEGSGLLGYGETRARWVLAATVLGSGMAMIDGAVVNTALPVIGRDLDADIGQLTWVVNAYTLTLAALILLGGSLGDRFGRRRVFVVGVVWFTVASLLCAAAPSVEALIAARALQGAGGALLTPGSLAIIQATFRPGDRARAIGAWSGLGGVAGAVAPLVGGWLVEVATWRWIFGINAPVAALVLLAARHIPETRAAAPPGHIDVLGAALGAAGLGALTLGLTAWSGADPSDPRVWAPLGAAVVLLPAFLLRERSTHAPLLPLQIFRSRLFSATNAVTFAVYAALGGVFFWLVLYLQVVVGFSPLAAGLALLPMTLLLLLLSARAGAWGQRVGPRLPMTVGPLLCAVGVAGLSQVGEDASYVGDVLPPVLLFGFGMAVTVAPLTATVLAAVPDELVGTASGVNNAVSRTAWLLAVAALPLLTGLAGEAYADPAELAPAYRTAMWVCAGLYAAGAVIAAVFVRAPRPEEAAPQPVRRVHCAIDGPPIEPVLSPAVRRGTAG
jgi:EmrB/QacA subfamily drug resistance transporter